MLINLIDYSKVFNSTNKGIFNDKVENNALNADRTKSLLSLLDKEKNIMEDSSKFIIDLKTLLSSCYHNDVELLARSINISSEQINDCLAGKTHPIPELIKEVERRKNSPGSGGDYIQIGDKIEINNSGEGFTNNYDGMMKGYENDIIKELKMEVSELHKMIKEKDKLIAEKERLIEVLMKK